MKRSVFCIGEFHNREKFKLWLGYICKCKLTEIKVHKGRTLQFLFHVIGTVYVKFHVHKQRVFPIEHIFMSLGL